jgi:AbrB family looped-hinge helix DNA binding protein
MMSKNLVRANPKTTAHLARTTEDDVPLVRIRRFAQVTLPAELRRKFQLEEGDVLEAEAVEHGILLRPMAVVDRESVAAAVEEGWADYRAGRVTPPFENGKSLVKYLKTKKQ